LASIVGKLVGMALKKPGHLRRDGLGQERAGTAAQHLRQWVGKRAWLGKLENITVGHGVSLLQWRSGGTNTPTIRRPTLACRHQLLRLALHLLPQFDRTPDPDQPQLEALNMWLGKSSIVTQLLDKAVAK